MECVNIELNVLYVVTGSCKGAYLKQTPETFADEFTEDSANFLQKPFLGELFLFQFLMAAFW